MYKYMYVCTSPPDKGAQMLPRGSGCPVPSPPRRFVGTRPLPRLALRVFRGLPGKVLGFGGLGVETLLGLGRVLEV